MTEDQMFYFGFGVTDLLLTTEFTDVTSFFLSLLKSGWINW